MKKQETQISESTMCVNQVFETLLNTVKRSNLNFHIQQTPFSAVISIKKSLIKDRFGSNLQSQLIPLDSKLVATLKVENQELKNRIDHLKKYSTALQRDLEEAVNESESANNTIKKLESDLVLLSDKLEVATNDRKVIESLTLDKRDLEQLRF